MRSNKGIAPSSLSFPTKVVSPYHVEGDQKELIIEKLRSEVQALKKNEQQFVLLKQQYSELDRKYKSQLEQKNLHDSDFRNRHESALRHISQLKNETEAIKAEVRDKKLEIEDLRADEETIKNSVDQRTIEIEKLRIDINALLCDSDELQNERMSLTGQVQSLRKTNSSLNEEMGHLERDQLGTSDRLSELQKYLDQLETQSQILKQKIKTYEDTNNDLDIQIQQSICSVSEMDSIIDQNQQIVSQLQGANATLGSHAEQLKSEGMHNQRACQAQVMKNNDLGKKLKQADNALRVRMGQVEEGRQQLQGLKQENNSLENMNNELDEDLQACRKHLENLRLLNHQLIQSLENFAEEDKRAAVLINREQRVKYLGERVQETSSIQFYKGKDTARTDASFTSSRRRYVL